MRTERLTNAEILAEEARIPDHVVYRMFTLETVVLNLQTGKYHGLDPTSGRMFELLAKTAMVHDVADQLAEEYGQPLEDIETDLCQLCRDLAERGLIEFNSNRPE
jgi:coenzyme PQQ synthesis protein D (PqqD)